MANDGILIAALVKEIIHKNHLLITVAGIVLIGLGYYGIFIDMNYKAEDCAALAQVSISTQKYSDNVNLLNSGLIGQGNKFLGNKVSYEELIRNANSGGALSTEARSTLDKMLKTAISNPDKSKEYCEITSSYFDKYQKNYYSYKDKTQPNYERVSVLLDRDVWLLNLSRAAVVSGSLIFLLGAWTWPNK